MTLRAPEKLLSFLQENQTLLKDFFIVSAVELASSFPREAQQSREVEGLGILITRAAGQKCQRCWGYDPKGGESAEHPSVCPRCRSALAALGAKGKS